MIVKIECFCCSILFVSFHFWSLALFSSSFVDEFPDEPVERLADAPTDPAAEFCDEPALDDVDALVIELIIPPIKLLKKLDESEP